MRLTRMSDDRKVSGSDQRNRQTHTLRKINNMVQLLKRIFPLVFGLVLGAGLTANAQTSNFRSLYLKDVDVWCGNTTTENTILNYCSGNGFNYIIFYDLGSFDFSSTTKRTNSPLS